MTGFKDMFSCEMYKVNRKKTLLKLAIALVVIIIATAVFSAILKGVLKDSSIGGVNGAGGSAAVIESLKNQISAFEENQTWLNKLLPDKTLYGLKSQLTMYEYLNENGIAPNGVTTYGVGNMFEFNFYAFTETSIVNRHVYSFDIHSCSVLSRHDGRVFQRSAENAVYPSYKQKQILYCKMA